MDTEINFCQISADVSFEYAVSSTNLNTVYTGTYHKESNRTPTCMNLVTKEYNYVHDTRTNQTPTAPVSHEK